MTFDPRLHLTCDEFVADERTRNGVVRKMAAPRAGKPSYGATWAEVASAKAEDRRRFPTRWRNLRAGRLKGSEIFAGDPCAYCNGPGEVFDHITPMKHGGRNRLNNITRACKDCNGHKGVRSALWWLATRCLQRQA